MDLPTRTLPTSFEAVVAHRLGDGGALRIEHGLFGHDGDDGFHARKVAGFRSRGKSRKGINFR